MVDGIVHNFWAGNFGWVWKILGLTWSGVRECLTVDKRGCWQKGRPGMGRPRAESGLNGPEARRASVMGRVWAGICRRTRVRFGPGFPNVYYGPGAECRVFIQEGEQGMARQFPKKCRKAGQGWEPDSSIGAQVLGQHSSRIRLTLLP